MSWQALGYPVCHQLAMRTFSFDGRFMPLCARCSGVYLGFLFTSLCLVYLAGEQKRGTELPSTKHLVLMFLFMSAMGFDVFGKNLGWYQPSNPIRLMSGLLMGFTLANFILPVFNFTFWRRPIKIRLLNDVKFIAIMVVLLGVYLSLIYLGNFLYWFFAFTSILGLWALYLAINSLIYLVVFKKENLADGINDLVPLGVISFIMSAVELGALTLFKMRLYS